MYFATFEDHSESNAASFFSYHAVCMVYVKIITQFLKAKLFFHILLIFVTSLLPTLNKIQVFPSSKFALIPLQLLEHNILQCPIIHIILPSQAIFQRNQQFKIQCDGVRSGLQVGCSNNFEMTPTGVCTCVAWYCHGGAALHTFIMWDRQAEGKHSDFFGFHYSDQSSVVILGNDIQKNKTCCILKDCHHFSTDGTHLKFIFVGEFVWHHSTIFHLDLG